MPQNHVLPFRIRHFLISLLVFFPLIFFAQGRVISSQIAGDIKEQRREMIGSRPPRCEGRCINCGGHCEPIQIPIAPQKTITHFLVNSRSDNLFNYKPISWKCKCGNSIFNP